MAEEKSLVKKDSARGREMGRDKFAKDRTSRKEKPVEDDRPARGEKMAADDESGEIKKIRIKKPVAEKRALEERPKERAEKKKQERGGSTRESRASKKIRNLLGDRKSSEPAILPKAEFDRENLTIRLRRGGTLTYKDVKRRYSRYSDIKVAGDYFVMKYADKEDARKDYKSGLNTARPSKRVEYLDNKYVLTNLSYKETEESIAERFKVFGSVERISIERNRDKVSVGRAIVTFRGSAAINEEVVMSSKLIGIERVRKPVHNYNRLFLSHINKSMTIVSIRKLVMSIGPRPTDIRLKYSENRRHNGYCFLTYETEEKAKAVAARFDEIKNKFGEGCYLEFSIEKARFQNGQK
jgi:hypothetical protein